MIIYTDEKKVFNWSKNNYDEKNQRALQTQIELQKEREKAAERQAKDFKKVKEKLIKDEEEKRIKQENEWLKIQKWQEAREKEKQEQ